MDRVTPPVIPCWGFDRLAKTGTYAVTIADRGYTIDCTSGTFAVNLAAAATLGSGFSFSVYNSGAGAITVTANGAETIRSPTGAANTLALAQGVGVLIQCDGTGFDVVANSGLVGASNGAVWGKINNPTALAITGAGAATLNRLHVVSGTAADYDITISGLSPSVGDVVGFYVKNYAAANKAFRLDAGGTVKIAGRTRYLTLVHTNVVLLSWDGTDWQPLVMCLDSIWVDTGAMTITAVTSNPTKGTTSTDSMSWRRFGDTCLVRYRYQQTVAGTAGTGTYRVGLPFPYDTTRVGTRLAEGSSFQNAGVQSALGAANLQQAGFTGPGWVYANTTAATHASVSAYNPTTGAGFVWNASTFPLSTATTGFGADIQYPAQDW